MYKALLLPALAALILAGCHGSESAQKKVTGGYLFEVSYTNFAWGYAHRGMYIDSAGGVHTFEWQRNGDRWEPKDDEVYTSADLAAKYAPGAATGGTIPGDTLRLMLDSFVPASTGSLSDTTHPMADAGVTRSSLYLYDAGAGTYRRIPLRQRGDLRFDNLAPAARTLADILDRYWSEAKR